MIKLPESITKKHITVGGVLVVLSVFGSAITYANMTGADIDLIVWPSEIEALEKRFERSLELFAGSIESLAKQQQQSEQFRLEQREDYLLLKIERSKQEGKQPDSLDLLELQQTRRQLDNLSKIDK